MSARTAGFLTAAATTLIALGLILWAFTGARGGADADQPATEARDIGPRPTIPDNVDTITPERLDDVIESTEHGHFTWLDKNDPDRVAGEVFYDVLDPQEAGRVHITRPEAWLYNAGGGAVRISADEASFVQPSYAGQPESGRFVDNVRITVFEVAPKDPGETDSPPPGAWTVRTDTLNFDFAIGEVSTSGPVAVDGTGLHFECRGLKFVFDQPRGRIAYLTTESDHVLTLDLEAMRTANESVANATTASTTAGASRAAETPSDPPSTDEIYYHLEITKNLRLAAGGRIVTADRIDAWLRLIGGGLPPDAIAQMIAPTLEQDGDAVATSGSSDPGADANAERENPIGVINITWAGPLAIRPLDAAPEQLAENHIYASLSSPQSGAVRLKDNLSGASVQCVDIAAALTTGDLRLGGRGSAGVNVSIPDMFEIICGRAELNFVSGVGRLAGPGVARAIGAAALADTADPYETAPVREINWKQQVHFELATRQNEGGLDLQAPTLIRQAILQDGVTARYGAMSVAGQFVRADFGATADGALGVRRLILEGAVRLDAAADGALTAERIDLEFDLTQPGPATPSVATAMGRVRAEREGTVLRAEIAELRLKTGDDGQLAVDTFTAEHDVLLSRPDGFEALALEARVFADQGAVELTGEPAVIRYQGGSIAGGSMRLEDEPRRLTVFGPGDLNYSRVREGALGYDRVDVKWFEQMTFDDTLGRITFLGECVATAEPSEFARDIVQGAHEIAIDLTPGLTYAIVGDEQQRGEVDIRRIHLTSAEVALGDGPQIEIESRRYRRTDPPSDQFELERIVHLRGPELIADAAEDSVVIPGAGRLFIENRAGSGESSGTEMGQGSSLFEWDGDFTLSRADGSAAMTRRVRLRNRPVGADQA
ncbi:MAG: hypothetical protein VYC34_01335, partial [Planctomycetota bacterium]|nr:hypothetical protein [Planctomycetota bacterium]